MEGFYVCTGLRKPVLYSSYPSASSTRWRPIFSCTVDGIQLNQALVHSKLQILSLKNASRTFAFTCSLPKGNHGGNFQLVVDDLSSKTDRSQYSMGSSLDQINCENISADRSDDSFLDLDVGLHNEAESASISAQRLTDICDREVERRRKIGLANKGRIPWNKGKKHSEETRERIKKKTIEALRDPKIREKMSQYPRLHSDQSKARISSSLRRIWEERLKNKRLQEKCYLLWAGSIAAAAKEGDTDQQELDWDSYERMKSEIMCEFLRRKEDKARAKEAAKLRAEMAVQKRAEKEARLAQQRKEEEEKAKVREMDAWKRLEDKKKIAICKGLKLKEKLTKFRHRKKKLGSFVSIQREMAIEPQPSVEKLDIALIKTQKMQRRVSFADQIQAVKNIKAEFSSKEFPVNALPISSVEAKAEDS